VNCIFFLRFGGGWCADLCHVADEVWDGGQRPAPDVHVRVHREVLVPHLDLGELDVHSANTQLPSVRYYYRQNVQYLLLQNVADYGSWRRTHALSSAKTAILESAKNKGPGAHESGTQETRIESNTFHPKTETEAFLLLAATKPGARQQQRIRQWMTRGAKQLRRAWKGLTRRSGSESAGRSALRRRSRRGGGRRARCGRRTRARRRRPRRRGAPASRAGPGARGRRWGAAAAPSSAARPPRPPTPATTPTARTAPPPPTSSQTRRTLPGLGEQRKVERRW
jgi:hypothetical protein